MYATLLPQARSKTLSSQQHQQKPNKFWKVLSSSSTVKAGTTEDNVYTGVQERVYTGECVQESVYTVDRGNIYTGNPGSRFPDPESSVQMLTYSQPDIVYFDLLRGVGADQQH